MMTKTDGICTNHQSSSLLNTTQPTKSLQNKVFKKKLNTSVHYADLNVALVLMAISRAKSENLNGIYDGPCPVVCPGVFLPVCAESDFPHHILRFTNACYQRKCECDFGRGLRNIDEEHCRNITTPIDLCPMIPPVPTPRKRQSSNSLRAQIDASSSDEEID